MKKPTPPKPTSLQPTESAADFISGGGKPSVTTESAPAAAEETFKAFSLRLDPALLRELHAIRDSRPKLKPQSIHNFILEAIQAAVTKEKRKASRT